MTTAGVLCETRAHLAAHRYLSHLGSAKVLRLASMQSPRTLSLRHTLLLMLLLILLLVVVVAVLDVLTSCQAGAEPGQLRGMFREFAKGGLVKGGLAIRHVFNFHIKNGA